MSPRPEFLTTRPDQVHHTQVRLAFLTDNSQARPAILRSVDGDMVALRELDGTVTSFRLHDGPRLTEVLERDDLCRLHGAPLVMVNQRYGVLAVATGPASPPSKLAMLIVSRLEGGGVVELLSGGEGQPAWQVFALRS